MWEPIFNLIDLCRSGLFFKLKAYNMTDMDRVDVFRLVVLRKSHPKKDANVLN